MVRRRALYWGAGALVAASCLVVGGRLWAVGQATAREIGEVLVREVVVMRLRATVGDQRPGARAEAAAERLNQALAAGAKGDDFAAGKLGAAAVIYTQDYIITRVEPGDAQPQGLTPEALASIWQQNLALALAESAAAAAATVTETPAEEAEGTSPTETESAPAAGVESASATGAEAQDPDYVGWENPDTKWVPIFSLANTGLHLGAAQVAGPSQQVAKVKGVAQLELTFRSLGRIRVYVPVSSISASLDRVQGVAVWATGDLEVLEF